MTGVCYMIESGRTHPPQTVRLVLQSSYSPMHISVLWSLKSLLVENMGGGWLQQVVLFPWLLGHSPAKVHTSRIPR